LTVPLGSADAVLTSSSPWTGTSDPASSSILGFFVGFSDVDVGSLRFALGRGLALGLTCGAGEDSLSYSSVPSSFVWLVNVPFSDESLEVAYGSHLL